MNTERGISNSRGSSSLQNGQIVWMVPLPAWQPVGENFTLSCRVPGAGPRGSLTLTLLAGTPGADPPQLRWGRPPRARGAVLTATVLARRRTMGPISPAVLS